MSEKLHWTCNRCGDCTWKKDPDSSTWYVDPDGFDLHLCFVCWEVIANEMKPTEARDA